MPLMDVSDSMLFVIDVQPGFYRDRPDVDDALFNDFVHWVAWVTRLAAALDVPTVVTVERQEKNGDTAEVVTCALAPAALRHPKDTFAVTGDGRLMDEIAALGRRTAVLTGMETDVCVAQSAIGLRDRDYRVAAVADALFAPGDAHRHGLERLRSCGTELISAKALFYEWLPNVDAVRALKRAHPELASPPAFRL